MLQIGLTGGMGSGKSTVADLFAQLGVNLIDADVISRSLTAKGAPSAEAIITHFGESFRKPSGDLDRSALRHLIFTDMEAKLWLEAFLHPKIREEIQKQLKKVISPYVIIVLPLLAETQPHLFVSRILVVDAPRELQIKRVMARDSTTREKAERMLSQQATREARLTMADEIIRNETDLTYLKTAVHQLHQKYSQMAKDY